MCLDQDDRNWTIAEEDNGRSFGMQTMLDYGYNQIKNNTMTGNHLIGIHTYDMLRNMIYITAFQYVSADTPNRADFIIEEEDEKSGVETGNTEQSDMVRIVLNLGYLRSEEAKLLADRIRKNGEDSIMSLKKGTYSAPGQPQPINY